MKDNKIVEFVKGCLLQGLCECHKEYQELYKQYFDNGCEEETPGMLVLLNSFVFNQTQIKFGESIKSVFIKEHEHSEMWEAVIIHGDKIYHTTFEATCVMVLCVKTLNTYKLTTGEGN